MSVDRVEIYTQPDHHQSKRHSSVEESIKEKLEDLIEKHPPSDEEQEESQSQAKEKEAAALEDIKKSNYTVHPEQRLSDSESESETEELVDIDGFEIPKGKIPLDSQFSTDELKVLLQHAQDEGILKENIGLKVLESGELGDRIRIADKIENTKSKENNKTVEKVEKEEEVDPKAKVK
ncbi:hypothetical protein KGF54_002756 [Candida jiufengensis]|uniref:uncharacterized protein n=1 Tax=Candida jiufengensis TaxID=497108 RepID=UPI002225AA45|nr:uncharacterized protein KGF54_002756 [Candida jiufengensis]KAI5953384.1 hypothetical protein KGF54_002756 [Candida jiufengensis]